eukprot:7231984-Pyramimonas_sp.AAC.2
MSFDEFQNDEFRNGRCAKNLRNRIQFELAGVASSKLAIAHFGITLPAPRPCADAGASLNRGREELHQEGRLRSERAPRQDNPAHATHLAEDCRTRTADPRVARARNDLLRCAV